MYFAAAVYLGTFADSRSFELVFLVVVSSVSDASHSQHACLLGRWDLQVMSEMMHAAKILGTFSILLKILYSMCYCTNTDFQQMNYSMFFILKIP